MLVLSRKVGESFIVGDNITVTVVRIAGGGVRLGIQAPSDCSIVRSELLAMLNKQLQQQMDADDDSMAD